MIDKPINVLVIDTSTSFCNLAVKSADSLYESCTDVGRSHSEVILPSIQNLMAEANLSLADLHLLVFAQGPGSFTGLRIATGVVQGLGFGLNIPVVSVSVLAALAQKAYREYGFQHHLVALTARKEEIYWGMYEIDSQTKIALEIEPERVVDVSMLDPVKDMGWSAIGNGWSLKEKIETSLAIEVEKTLSDSVAQPVDLLNIGLWKFENGDQVFAEDATPVYLRERVAS